jgi:TP901 family phage tail tape measure protein
MSEAALNVRLGAKTKEFQAKMAAASKRVKKLGKNISAVGRSMTTMFTVPLLAAGAASIKLSLDFQKSMTKIQTLVGRTAEEIEVMKAGIMEMSTKTAKSPVELAEGLYFLESAGLSGANAMETLESVAKGSAIGLGDMESLSIVAAASQNAYGEEVLTSTEALDKFAVMVRTGMFDANELSNVLGKQLGLASSLGINFDEVGAIISTFTQTTGDATGAATGLSSIMTTFAKLDVSATANQAAALEKIGMSAEQVKIMLGEQGLQSTMQHLKDEFDANGLSMGNFFESSIALKTSLSVLGEQSEAYADNLDMMKESAEGAGMVNEAFAITAETDAFKMEQAMNNLKVAGTSLGESLTPVIQAISEKIMALTNWWNGLDKSTKDNYASWGVWIATVGPALVLIGGIVTKVGTMIGLMKKFAVFQKVVTAAQWLWNTAMTANPIGVIIMAIAAVIAAIVYFATSTSGVAITVRNAWRTLANGIIMAINLIIASANSVSSVFGYTIEPLKLFEMEATSALENTTDAVDDTSDAVADLAGNLDNLPDVDPIIPDDDDDDDGGGGSGGGDDKKLKNELASLEKIRKLKQQFNVLNEKDSYKSSLIALENERQNALLGVKETQYSEDEKLAINNKFNAKLAKLQSKNTENAQKEIDNQKTAWESMFDSISEGWNNTMNLMNQVMSAFTGLADAKAEKEQIEMDNKHALENEDYNLWYEGELKRIEDTITNEDQKNAAIESLDMVAAEKENTLQEKQDEETKRIQKKAAQREKKMNIFNSIIGTASAVVKALGSAPPPLNFILAGIVGTLGIAQTAAIASTPIPLAKGGIAFGPTNALIGEYAGAKNNPEVVAPLDKLKGMLGGSGGVQRVEVFGRLDGNDIWLSNDFANNNRKRFT